MIGARKQQAPDWPVVIREIVATGLTLDEIAGRPGVGLSLRAVKYLADPDRGQQPFYHRGEWLICLWVERTKRSRDDLPMADVVRGFRKGRSAADTAPRLQNLPQFPVPQQRTDLQGKSRRAKKEKEPA